MRKDRYGKFHHMKMLSSKVLGELVAYPKTYTFQSNKKYHWLQKACIWILDQLQCEYTGYPKRYPDTEIYTTTTWPIDKKKLFETVYSQMRNIYQHTGKYPTKFIVGYDDWMEFLGADTERKHIHATFSVEYNEHQYTGPFNLKVEIVPWIQGWILLP